ncbi:hypothetical protein [Yinghuangia soli]|uniref:Uncharacterized protein n=1 Tax=Yinghuangia soli TaxID=2908204 RepID=A0AA41PVQ9_9ACTN|nr:hypothetical protein [Yinghuangia soli]MCF2526235.1 hypothetical protein [Yinghuangia soli]
MMATPSSTAHMTGIEIDAEFDRYRHVVAEIFDCHHRSPETPETAGGPATCTCGSAWPCAQEMLAAELLDWI